MNHESLPVAAATLAAAILAKTELPASADVAREALRIYRQTLQRITQAGQPKANPGAVPTKHET